MPRDGTPVGEATPAGRIGYAAKRNAARKFLAEQAKRPRVYAKEIAEALFLRVAGGETLTDICREPEMPSFPTVHAWIQTHGEFASRISRAREIQSHAFAEQGLKLADDASNDLIVQPDGRFTPNNAAVQRSRLRVDHRKWLAGKLNPAAYADKQIHTGPDGLGPVEVQVRADYDRLSVEELDQLRELLERASGVLIDGEPPQDVVPDAPEGTPDRR